MRIAILPAQRRPQDFLSQLPHFRHHLARLMRMIVTDPKGPLLILQIVQATAAAVLRDRNTISRVHISSVGPIHRAAGRLSQLFHAPNRPRSPQVDNYLLRIYLPRQPLLLSSQAPLSASISQPVSHLSIPLQRRRRPLWESCTLC